MMLKVAIVEKSLNPIIKLSVNSKGIGKNPPVLLKFISL
jgi:hypothetical protein